MLAALVKIGMREFEEGGENIGVGHAFGRQVTVRIKFRSNHHARTDHGADTLQQVTFAIMVTLRHHRAVQAEDDSIDRQCCFQLVEDFIAQAFVSLTLNKTARLRPCRRALNQGKAFAPGPLAKRDDG